MNILWGSMILIGIIYSAVTGTMQEVSDAALSSAREAVTLCITMVGVMALWVGLMEIARESGMIAGLTRKMKPFIRFLFPRIPEGHPAQEHISVNVIANILGLGWAATPAGLKAMEALSDLEEERRTGVKTDSEEREGKAGQKKRQKGWMRRIGGMPREIASNEMCTFLIINISSLQLIPVNMIAYRSQYGSVNPTAIVGPGIAATAVSTLAAIVFCKVMDGKRENKKG